MQFEKIEEHEYSFGINDEVPPDYHLQYEFYPRPPKTIPPIKPWEFKCRFYTCFQGGSKHRHLFLKCRKPCRLKKDALDRIPKCDRSVIEEGDQREIFWGLLAVEQISFAMVAMYHFLILAPTFVFWMLWLFVWGHRSDLQNASVPFLSTIPLLSLFWLMLVKRDG
jgi:hypothetical protein